MRATRRRWTGSSRDTSSRCNDGHGDDCRRGRATSRTHRILSRTPSSRRSGTSYLRQGVLNRIRNELRRTGRHPRSSDLDRIEVESADSPLEQAIGREAVERYERALQVLKPDEREVIIARVEMGYTYEEVAEALGKPTPEAARKAARRALERLAQEMARAAERPAR
jgi:RNA polymerase sigma factor (sigma-70 family)